jgi:hypothetical protein
MDKNKIENFKEKWDIIAEKIGGEQGKKIVAALKELYAVYDDRMVEWMASLYDPEAGAWYHSRSGQMTEGYGPDAESTIEVFGFWQATGMTGGKPYEQVAPEWLKKRVAKFCYELQDEDGYFYHPQWGKQYYIDNNLMSRRSRDGDWCRHLIRVFSDGKFKYPLPGAPKAAADGKKPDVPKQWQSLENYMAHLEELDIKNKSYWACNLLLAEASERNMYSATLGVDLQKITLDFLDANNSPETGFWQKPEDGINYYSMNSLHKCSRLYNAAKRPIPNVEKGIRNTMAVIMSDEPTGGAVDVYNPWHVIGDCMYNLANFQGEEGRALAQKLLPEIYDWAAAAILKSAEKIVVYKMPDGGMSYLKKGWCDRSQGAPVAIPGSREGDINGNCCASSAVVTSVYHALNLSAYMVPMFTEDDLKNFLNIIEAKEKAWLESKLNTPE